MEAKNNNSKYVKWKILFEKWIGSTECFIICFFFSAEYTFPAVTSRLRVINSEEEDLSPIVVAIDDMQRRVTELRSERNSMDLKRIQLRLQGSVSVQVRSVTVLLYA